MVPQNLTEQLMALPDIEAQRRFLYAHASALPHEEVARRLKEQADQYLRADIQRCMQTAELLFALAELTEDPQHRALGLLVEANARSIGLGEYERAITLYDQAAQIYQTLGDEVAQARSQVGKVGSLANLGRYAEALEAGQWASRVLEEQGQWPVLGALTLNIATVHGRAGDDVRSLEMFDRAAALYRRLGAEGEPAWLWIQQSRAVALRNLGRFEESIQASETAWEGLSGSGQRVEAARARQGLALTYFILGRYNEALAYFDQVRNVFIEDGRQRDGMLVELYISDCLLQLRRFGDVLEKCQEVRRLFTELGMRLGVAQAILNEAVAYAELGRYAEALSSLGEAREILEETGNPVRVAGTDLEVARVLGREGRFEESLEVARRCAAVFQRYDLPVEKAQAHLVAARAAQATGQGVVARELAQRALAVGEERNVPILKYQGHHLRADLAAADGEVEAALDAYALAVQDVERLRGRLMVEFRVGFIEDKEEIYEDAIDLCLTLDQPVRGLEYAERAKSRALLDLLAHRLDLRIDARGPADYALVEELMALRAERDRLYRRWESDAESGERGWSSQALGRGEAQQEVLALERRITELWHKLLIHNADYAREASLWNVRTEPVQPFLDPDTLLVEYFVVHGKLVVFLVARDAVRALRLDADLQNVQRLLQLLWLNLRSVPGSDQSQMATLRANAEGLLERLYRHVLAPLEETVRAYRRLIIVPHGPLHYVPFQALHDGRSFLLERHEISHLPGASFLRFCRETGRADGGLCAVGYSYEGRLPYAREEARAVAALFDGTAFLEEEATLERVRSLFSTHGVLHLAAHGDFRADNPLFSGLALADGWLTTLDVFNLQLKASLVTLSACQTGRSVVSGGDELLGLMRAFLSAGAASVVLSLWAVEDRSTARLMTRFYQELARGSTKGEALRQAQLGLLQGAEESSAPGFEHPYFWAPFFLIGDNGRL